MANSIDHHRRATTADILTSEVASAEQRISRTELAIQRTEAMLAENIALRSRIRTAVEVAVRLVNRAG
ncbi:hypothetical protein [Mesorhizobium australicum]|uniref:hypothetical protein n=1 Tax=Mesorhizobium australicum TaxID=536018 RepID=UPI00333C55A2